MSWTEVVIYLLNYYYYLPLGTSDVVALPAASCFWKALSKELSLKRGDFVHTRSVLVLSC